MEVVRAFNKELTALYEAKPPISKAKMTSITKCAIKGLKFYKHIVQSVEKFIQKCRPEYKVPGLYVVDSIVRQSRHQFGADKDVFGPRFVKSFNQTFHYLFKCNPDDRSKIIRVLNLWQKNAVFPIEVIQPLLDMGHPTTSSENPSDPSAETTESPLKTAHQTNDERHKMADNVAWKGWSQANDEPATDSHTYAEMSTKNVEKFMKAEMSKAMEEEQFKNIEKRMQKLEENTVIKKPEEKVKFNKKLLDFDYGDEEEEEDEPKSDENVSMSPSALALRMAQNLLSNPDLLRQLQQIQQNESLNSDAAQRTESSDSTFMANVPPSPQQPPLPNHEAPLMPMPPTDSDKDDRVLPQPPLPAQDLDERSLAAIMAPHRPVPPVAVGAYLPTGLQADGDKDDRILPDVVVPPRDLDERSLAAILAPLEHQPLPPMPFTEASTVIPYRNNAPFPPQQPPLPIMDPSFMPALPPDPHPHMMPIGRPDEDERMYSMPGEPRLPPQDFDERNAMMMSVDERPKKNRSRSRSGSRSRGRSGRRRSRSRSPRRKRSRSRSRQRKSRVEERIREKANERERERERKKKGLPAIKKGCVSVCSTTLWVGHVPKSCAEEDIREAFSEFGTISSIFMIHPRGCAYVVMDKRQDASKALQKLKKLKIHSCNVKMAWAPGKGVKGKEFKQFWEVEDGVSYVPYDHITESVEVLEALEEGGFIDEESLSDSLKALKNQAVVKTSQNDAIPISMAPATTTAFNTLQGPPMVPPPIMPPTSNMQVPGMVLPHLMQPQFGLPMPGLLPPQAMVMQMPMGIPPPNPMLMVQQQSQNLLNPMGLAQMLPRAVPTALSNLKANEAIANSPAVPAGDATPTDEDGTSITASSANVSNSVSTVSSSQPVTQFNPMLGMQNTNRPLLPVPPPVSSSGTPIPYPPPHVGFSFPPPGVRLPGQMQNPQFHWMQQKPGNAPLPDIDPSQLGNLPPRTPQQPGMQRPGFNNRPQFSDKSLPPKPFSSIEGQDNVKDPKSIDADNSGNRSPSRHQDMVISTDDESSLDPEYPRNELGPRFPGLTEFPRMPVNMHPGRGPPGPMHGMRFPRGVPPFPMRMHDPRSMHMHPNQRMDRDFPMPPDPHGHRMPGPPRRDNPPEGREWYPRDYDGPPPPFERENRYERDDWQRDSWGGPDKRDSMRRSRDFEESDERRNSRSLDDKRNDRDTPRRVSEEKKEPIKPSPAKKSKPNDDLLGDMLKLRFYQRDKDPKYASHLNKQLVMKKEQAKTKNEPKANKKEKDTPQVKSDTNPPQPNNDLQNKTLPKESVSENHNSMSRKDKDREARKRSRWGRTLSEEREFQIQKSNEIEMKQKEIELKFQSYEQSSLALQKSINESNDGSCDNLNENTPNAILEPEANNAVPTSEVNNAVTTSEVNNAVPTSEVDSVVPEANNTVSESEVRSLVEKSITVETIHSSISDIVDIEPSEIVNSKCDVKPFESESNFTNIHVESNMEANKTNDSIVENNDMDISTIDSQNAGETPAVVAES